MKEIAVIRSLARQLVHAGKEMQIISNEIESADMDSLDVVEVYNALIMQELEKAQFAVLSLTERLIGGESESETDESDSGTAFVERNMNDEKKDGDEYGQ